MKNRILNIIGSLKSSLVVFFIFISIIINFEVRRILKFFFWRCGLELAGEGVWIGRRDEVF